MAELPSRANLGDRDPQAARSIPQYPNSSPVAEVLQRAGAVGQNIAFKAMAEAKATADREQEFGVYSRFLQWDSKWGLTELERRTKAPSGAAGYADSLRPDFNKSAQEFLKTVPERLRPEYANKIMGTSTSVRESATKYEMAERERFAVQTATTNDDYLTQRVRTDPGRYDEAVADAEKNWKTAGLRPDVTDERIIGSRKRLAVTLFEARRTTDRGEREKLGVVPGGGSGSYVDRVAGVESGNNPRAKNPRSTATGLGQVIESTWTSFMRERHPDLMKGNYQNLRNDPALSREAIQWYADQNAAGLRSAGLPVRDGTLYLAHFAGPGGARAVLTADPNAPIEQVLTPGQISANPFLRGKSAGDVIAWADRKMGTGGGTSEPAPEYAVLSLEERQKLYGADVAEENAAVTAANNELVKSGYDIVRDGDLTADWLETNRDNLSPTQYRAFSNAVTRSGVDAKTDNSEYTELFKRATGEADQGVVQDDAFEALSEGRLSKTDFNKLFTLSRATEANREDKPWLGDIRKTLATRLAPVNRDDKDQYAKRLDGLFELDDWVSANPKATRDEVKKKSAEIAKESSQAIARDLRAGLDLPRFGSVARKAINQDSVALSAQKLITAYKTGKIGIEELNRETALLKRWNGVLDEEARNGL